MIHDLILFCKKMTTRKKTKEQTLEILSEENEKYYLTKVITKELAITDCTLKLIREYSIYDGNKFENNYLHKQVLKMFF